MRPLLINTTDIGGGAASVVMNLHTSYLARGLDSKMLVNVKRSDMSSVYEIQPTNWYRLWQRFDRNLLESKNFGVYRFHNLIKYVKAPVLAYSHKTGKEIFHFPGSKRAVGNFRVCTDIIHLHNLHYDYFDLRVLSNLQKEKPILITMHDEYLYTGLCASTNACDRWRTGCGNCPQLKNYPQYKLDNTHFNWKRKKSIFAKCNVTLVAPSLWLASRSKESILSHLPIKVIPNGVDLSVFKQGSKDSAREELGLDKHAFIILHIGKSGRPGKYKDFEMLERVLRRLQSEIFDKPVILLSVGGSQSHKEIVNNIEVIKKPSIKNLKQLVMHYQACDLLIHTTNAEIFGLVIAEAMSCGKPVVSTNAGGIPELIRDGETGFTVPIGDDEGMVSHIKYLLNNQDQVSQMGEKAGNIAAKEFGMKRMVDNYLDLYMELLREYHAKIIV